MNYLQRTSTGTGQIRSVSDLAGFKKCLRISMQLIQWWAFLLLTGIRSRLDAYWKKTKQYKKVQDAEETTHFIKHHADAAEMGKIHRRISNTHSKGNRIPKQKCVRIRFKYINLKYLHNVKDWDYDYIRISYELSDTAVVFIDLLTSGKLKFRHWSGNSAKTKYKSQSRLRLLLADYRFASVCTAC